MLTNYNPWYIKRDDNGLITECVVRFFEGDITTQDEFDLKTGKTISVTRYRATKILQAPDLSHLKKTVDANKDNAVTYTNMDFGKIKSDEEAFIFLNKELAKDPSRTPISEQK